jgi:hypothetical protein
MPIMNRTAFRPALESLECREGPSAMGVMSMMSMMSMASAQASTTTTSAATVAGNALNQLSSALGTLRSDLAANKSPTTLIQDGQKVASLTVTAIGDLAATPPSMRGRLDVQALGLATTELQDGFAVFSRGFLGGDTGLASAGSGLAITGLVFTATEINYLFMDVGANGLTGLFPRR